MKYPHKCSRCGFCCISETCVPARITFRIGKRDPCPALVFDGTVASCTLGSVPFGDGCCIKARMYRRGVEFDFAGLPHDWKLKAVQQVKRGQWDLQTTVERERRAL